MVDHNQYILKVTAGPSYNPRTHQEVKVNTSEAVTISSDHIDASIRVRIKNFRGKSDSLRELEVYFQFANWSRSTEGLTI